MRIFIGISLSALETTAIKTILQPLMAEIPENHWVPPEKWHATLIFLGEQAEMTLTKLYSVMQYVSQRIRSFVVTIKEIKLFPDAPSHILAAHIEGQSLHNLFLELSQQIKNIGFVLESRAFCPHITLLRSKTTIHDFNPIPVNVPWAIHQFIIFESEMINGEHRYRALKKFTFNRGEYE